MRGYQFDVKKKKRDSRDQKCIVMILTVCIIRHCNKEIFNKNIATPRQFYIFV
jgi:hypothetical protein